MELSKEKDKYLSSLINQVKTFAFLRPHEIKRIINELTKNIDELYVEPKQYTFIIEKEKVYAAQRPRVGRGRMYAPDKQIKEHITELIKDQIEEKYTKEEFENVKYREIEVSIFAGFSLPKKLTKYEQVLYKLGLMFMIKKPDVDNIAKIYLDAANGLLWQDDAQITKLTVEKKYVEENILKIDIKYK